MAIIVSQFSSMGEFPFSGYDPFLVLHRFDWRLYNMFKGQSTLF